MELPTYSFHEDQQLFHRIYRLYNGYRILLAITLIAMAQVPGSFIYQNGTPTEVALLCVCYGAHALVGLFLVRTLPGTTQTFAITFLEIILISFLVILGGNTDNGLANLMFAPIAVGNVLIQGRTGVVLAAMASLFLLIIDYYTGIDQILDAGLKGMLFFTTAIMIQGYNLRLKTTVHSAHLSRNRAVNLQKLSQTIMQHMRTGILVLREPDQVVMMNEASAHMLASTRTSGELSFISNQLQSAYHQWCENPRLRLPSFRATPDTPEVQPSFTRLAYEADVYVLVFLDDKALMSQHAQQLKLAALGQLTASIAHEIRNPLGAISHSAQLLSESEELDQADRKLLDIIHKHSQRMNDIIETILQLSRKESWHPEPLEINAWLKHFIQEEHFDGFPQPQISFQPIAGELKARFDIKQLHQVVLNLCLNGLRYSQQKTGTAALNISTGIGLTGHAWIEVQDQGPGIPEAQREHIFAPFFTTDKNGTGLGLYISRELCEANQSSLELLPATDDSGCTFRITFAHPGKRIEYP